MSAENKSIDILKKLTEEINNNQEMLTAKRRTAVKHLRRAYSSILEDDEYYINEKKIAKISSWLMVVFTPMFVAFSIIYSYGIANIIAKESNLAFYVGIASFAIAMSNAMTAPLLFHIYKKITKSA